MVVVAVVDDVDDIVEGAVVVAAAGGKLTWSLISPDDTIPDDIIFERLRIHQIVCPQV